LLIVLIQATHQKNILPDDYFYLIHQKMLDSNWVVKCLIFNKIIHIYILWNLINNFLIMLFQIVYKALMLIHILMREGDSVRILEYLASYSTEDWWELPNLSIKTDIGIKIFFINSIILIISYFLLKYSFIYI